MKKIYLAHLGCAKNMVDSEILLSHFNRLGFETTQEATEADLVLVNTCGFIQSAKEQSIHTIFTHRNQTNKKLVVTGCLFQRYDSLPREIPEADGWLKTNKFEEVRELAKQLGFRNLPDPIPASEYARTLFESTYHAYLRISEGCDKSCSFCSIPGFKGKMVSRSVNSLVEEAKMLIDKGVKEISIVSQDTSNYGSDLYGPTKGGNHLRTLLEKLVLTGIQRIRLLYLYPLWLNEEFYEFMAKEDKICNYIDMPLQHASEKILRSMKRPGNAQRYLEELEKIRKIFSGNVALRSTFIVGFPNETEEDFQELCNFVKAAKFDWMGAFTYSKEEGTSAFQIPGNVHWKTKEKRKSAIETVYKQTFKTSANRMNTVCEALIEEEIEPGLFCARTWFQAPEVDGVTYIRSQKAKVGEMIQCRITNQVDFDLEAVEV